MVKFHNYLPTHYTCH